MNAKLLSVLLVSALFAACGPEVRFTEPMPPNEKDLASIPLRYRGDYVNGDGNLLLHIDKEKIVREYDYDIRIHRDSINAWDSLSGDTLWNQNNKEFRVVSLDSAGYITFHVNEEETMFSIADGHKVRKFKGRLFLNYPGRLGWIVEQVRLKKGILSIASISSLEEIEALNESVENDSDTIASSYSPTKKQFREFVKTEGFGNGEEYYRMK